MRRALLVMLAAIMVIAGAGLLAVSTWVYSAFGSDGVATSSLGTITSAPTSSAIIIDVESARVQIPVLPVHGRTTLRLDSGNARALLAGVANTDTVDAFIGTREFDAAYRSKGAWSLAHVSGVRTDDPWASSPSWLITGSPLDLPLEEGQTVAIANASGAAGVLVEASLQYSAPRAPVAALVLGISGAVLLLAGLALAVSALWLMGRRVDERRS